MSSTYGENLKLSVFGQSHGPAIGMTLDGIPAGLSVNEAKLQQFVNRRAPGQSMLSTSRKEEDMVQILSGILNGYTCGAPIAAIIQNQDAHSSDYGSVMDVPRPGHADYTAHIKYGGFEDARGGGHFSGRLTAPICIAGGLCLQWLEEMGIQIRAEILSVGSVKDGPETLDWCSPDLKRIRADFPVINQAAGEKMKQEIAKAKQAGNSLGGWIRCFITGLPAGIGEPMFGGMESRIAQIIYGIPAVKGLEFGSGFASADFTGRENNDAFRMRGTDVITLTNHAGGILGGITTGMPLIFTAAIKPTPSIALPQKSVSISRKENTTLRISGRHDPCIVPRAVPVVEAAAAVAVYDAILGNTQSVRRNVR